MKSAIFRAFALAPSLAAQTLVANRGPLPGKSAWQRVELAGEGFLGDSFPVGAAGEIWMSDTIRPGAAPAHSAATCSRDLGDALATPGGQEVLFAPRATGRPKAACALAASWSLAAASANAGDRLRKFNEKGVPEGFMEAAAEPVRINVRVWAHKVD